MNIIKSLYKYIIKLASTWYVLASLVLFILSLLTLFSPTSNKVNALIQNINNCSLLIFIICFFIASYQVWLEVQQELDKIKKNPIDYKVTAKIQKIFINLDKIKKGYKTKEEIKEALDKCENEILDLEKLSQVDKSSEMKLRELFDNNKPTNKYLTELNSYKRELESYMEKSQENFSQWNKLSENFKTIYIVDFYIESVGNKSDKNVDVEIQLENNCYIENLLKLKNFPRILNTPTSPEKYTNSSSLNSIISNDQSPRFPMLQHTSNKDAYRKFMKFKENSLFVNLRDMNVGDNISIFKEKVLIDLPKKEEIIVTIKSENSNAKIEQTIEFEIEENLMEYYDYLKSQLD